jgi:hypothetical protein
MHGLKQWAIIADTGCWRSLVMGMSFTSRRVEFARITRKYLEYIKLYRDLNGGSQDGATPFNEFYWHMTYYSRYVGGKRPDQGG